jgi:ADP-ribose pyrophosphatase YjhB (NUDIX family)
MFITFKYVEFTPHFMIRIPIAGVIIEQDGMILFHRREFEPGKGKLDVVGGFVDSGELPAEAAIREAKEESGYDVKLIQKICTEPYFERQHKEIHLYRAAIVSGSEKGSVEGHPVWVKKEDVTKEMFAFEYIYPLFEKWVL